MFTNYAELPLPRLVTMETISKNVLNLLISGFVWTRDEFVIKKKKERKYNSGRIVDFPPSARLTAGAANSVNAAAFPA